MHRGRLLIALLALAYGCPSTPEFPGPPPCDELDPGPDVAPLVYVPGGGGTYGIDATEVTSWQYGRFLEAVGDDVSGQPGECGWNTTYEPDPSCFRDGDLARWQRCGKLPAVCVDWCDARAYCAWAGKRLCGAVGGGPAPYAGASIASEWVNACSAGGRNDYVFGEYDETVALRCHGPECASVGHGSSCLAVQEVGSAPDCQSDVPDYAGVFDLAGNVLEFEDACDDASGAMDRCTARGGSTTLGGSGLACSTAYALLRSSPGSFRCCAD